MTTIEWTDETWNPTTGCDRISPGCDNCYALTMAKRLKGMGSAKYQNDGDPRTSGPGFALTMHPDSLTAPLRWRKPRKVFVNSMSDLFHKDVTDEFIAQVFAVMALTPQHTYQVLTKRPQRMRRLLTDNAFPLAVEKAELRFRHAHGMSCMASGFPWLLPNVWLGTSIESDRYTFRADHLRATPAAVRFISAEPLLGPLPSLNLEGIDWLIVGGESGHGARPMHPDWVRDLRDCCCPDEQEWRCTVCGHEDSAWDEGGHYVAGEPPLIHAGQLERTGPALFFKQWGGLHPKANGRVLDGRTWDEYPTDHPKGPNQ